MNPVFIILVFVTGFIVWLLVNFAGEILSRFVKLIWEEKITNNSIEGKDKEYED